MTTTQTPKWHNHEVEILTGPHLHGRVNLGDVAEWLEDMVTEWDEEEMGEPAPELTEAFCSDMAADYLEHLASRI